MGGVDLWHNEEQELQQSNSSIEKMEESISSMTLESQCEIESIKMAMEHRCLEGKKVQEEALQLKNKMSRLIGELHNAPKTIEFLESENEELRSWIRQKGMHPYSVKGLMENKEKSQNTACFLIERDRELTSSLETSCGEVLGRLLPKLAVAVFADANPIGKMDAMLHQIQDYEGFVKQLKDELREEKLKAKEEAEDLAQKWLSFGIKLLGC